MVYTLHTGGRVFFWINVFKCSHLIEYDLDTIFPSTTTYVYGNGNKIQNMWKISVYAITLAAYVVSVITTNEFPRSVSFSRPVSNWVQRKMVTHKAISDSGP